MSNKEFEKQIQEHLGYTAKEGQEFLDNPRNQYVLSKTQDLLSKTIVAEIINSHGCNSQHKVGDKLYFDGAGNLLTKLSGKRICIYALSALDKLIFATNELIYAGVDPNDLRFNRTSCFDVGLNCGGWGQIVMELRVVDRKTLEL